MKLALLQSVARFFHGYPHRGIRSLSTQASWRHAFPFLEAELFRYRLPCIKCFWYGSGEDFLEAKPALRETELYK